MSKFIPLESVLDVNDSRLWYYIPGFNGYEISDDGYLRSMKHFKKYPFGLIIQSKRGKNKAIISPDDPVFELSNNQNERVSIKLSQIRSLANNNQYIIGGYPRRTYVSDVSSRNQRCTIKKKKKFGDERFMPKFNVVKELDHDDVVSYPWSNNKYKQIISPIEIVGQKE